MRIFATAAFACSLAIIASQYLLTPRLQFVIAAAVFLCGFLSLLLKGDKRKRIMLISFGLCAGFLWNGVYTTAALSPAEKLDGARQHVTAEVCGFPVPRDYGASLKVKVQNDEGRTVTAQLYAYDSSLDGLLPGDKIEFTADFSLADTINGEKTDYFFSRGSYLLARNIGDFAIIESGDSGIKYAHLYLSHAISEKIKEIFPDSTRAFAQALLLGDKTDLQEDTQTVSDMERSGIYHIATVSGMHVSILTAFITMLIGKRRRSAIIILPVLFFFMAASGFTPSVTRAVIMQMFLLLAPVFNRESDSVTSLSAAMILILLVNPFTAKNVGFQLSFAATLGIILFTPGISGFLNSHFGAKKLKSRRVKGLILTAYSGISSCVGAMLLTVPLSAVYFGYVSIIAPITNLLILWAVTPAFSISAVAIALGFISPAVGAIAAKVASLPIKYIVWVAGKTAGTYLAAVYIDNILLIIWLIYVYIAVILFIALKAKPRQLLLPACVAVTSLCLILIINSAAKDREEGFTMTVLDVGQGQSIVVTSGEFTALIDCGSSSGEYAGEIAASYVYGLGRDSVDLLLLTHYHADHANGVDEFMARIDVGAIVAPLPENDDSTLDEEITELAASSGTDMIYVTEDMSVSLGDTKIYLYAPMGSGSENERGVCMLISQDGFEALVTGDIDSSLEKQLIGKNKLPDIECLVVGHHGSKYSTCTELLDAVTPEVAVISVGYNSYGHPTQEALERLYDAGVQVYRTDTMGNVTINSKDSLG